MRWGSCTRFDRKDEVEEVFVSNLMVVNNGWVINVFFGVDSSVNECDVCGELFMVSLVEAMGIIFCEL